MARNKTLPSPIADDSNINKNNSFIDTNELKSLIHPSLTRRQNEILNDTNSLLSQTKFDKGKRVFDYINKKHILEHQNDQKTEQQQQKQFEEEMSQTESNPHTLFKILFDTRNYPQNLTALRQLIIATLLMITFPIAALYSVKYLLIHQLNVNSSSALTYGAIVAVIFVNIITIGFGLYAYHEKEEIETEDILIDREQRMKEIKQQFIQKAKKEAVEQLQDEYIQHTDKEKQNLQQISNPNHSESERFKKDK